MGVYLPSCVSVLQRSSSTRQGAPVGVYLPCCVNTAEELFYKTRSTSRIISTLLGVVILQRSSFTRQGAPVGVHLPCCVCKYRRGALLHDMEHKQENNLSVLCSSTAEEFYHTTWNTIANLLRDYKHLLLQRGSSTY